MKIVIISDIHGNLEAVTALQKEFDELWVLGACLSILQLRGSKRNRAGT